MPTPQTLCPLSQFNHRFKETKVYFDSFKREYTVAMDQIRHCRTLIKKYNESAQALQNILIYQSIRQSSGLCQIIQCTRNQNSQLIVAFQYDDITLQECILLRRVNQSNALPLYSYVLEQLSTLIAHSLSLCLQIEDLSLSSVLLSGQQDISVRVFYDEREVDCSDAHVQAIYWSAEKLTARINNQEYASEEEAVFQVGMLMLDFIYYSQISMVQSQRNISQEIRSSVHAYGRNSIKLDLEKIRNKITYIKNCEHMKNIAHIVESMVAVPRMRTNFTTVIGTIKILNLKQSSKQIGEIFSTREEAEMERIRQIKQKQQEVVRNNSSILQFVDSKLMNKLPNQEVVSLTKFYGEVGGNVRTYKLGSRYLGGEDSFGRREGKGIYITANQEVYFGEWHQNVLTLGTYFFSNGETFTGTVDKGKQGWGTYKYTNGSVFEGEWVDDKRHGTGIMSYQNGDSYEGEWSGGEKHGAATYRYANGMHFKGTFKHGVKSGFGVLTFPNNTVVQAQWQGSQIEGVGKIKFANGDKFQGQFHMSQKEGSGKYQWDDCIYEGNFHKDVMEGQGCVHFQQKQKYEGHLLNGRRNGYGRYDYASGDYFVGEWRNNNKVQGDYYFANGCLFSGRFKDNELHNGVLKYAAGDSYEGEIANGVRSGLGVYRSKTGQALYEGVWQDDQFLSSTT